MKSYIIKILSITLLFISCEEIIYEEDISEENVILLAPQEGVEITEGTLSFSWSAVEYADEYNIQIATPTFESATQIVLDSVLTETTLTQDLLSGTYQWRAKAINSAYETAYTTHSFTVIE